MENVLTNGFCEMTQDEVMVVDGGQEWYEWVGDLGYIACGVAAYAMAGTVLGGFATAAVILYSIV